MKVGPNYDFPIAVIAEWGQVSEEEREFFQGVYTLSLNYFSVGVTFVPTFERNTTNWPPDLSNYDGDHIFSAQDARLYSAESTRYSVTPDLNLAGHTEVLLHTSEGFFGEERPDNRVIFYVSPAQFEQFIQDIDQIYERIYSEDWISRLGIPISHLNTYSVIKFLLNRIVNSPYLTDFQMEMLGRPRNKLA